MVFFFPFIDICFTDSALLSQCNFCYITFLGGEKKEKQHMFKKSVFTPNTDLSLVYSCLLHAEVLFCEVHQVTILGHFFARA